MAELVRMAALTGYLETMAILGADSTPLLREQGLSRDQLANPEQLLPARATMRLLERSAEETGCITFGLRMAEVRSIANLGATSLLIAHQPNLRSALKTLTEYRTRINSTLVLNVEQIEDEVILREDFSLQRPEPSQQASNLAIGVLARICSSVLGDSWAPRTVCFSHEAPPTPERHMFSRFFRCQPEFDSEFNGLVLTLSDLDRKNPAADEQLANHARHLLDSVMSSSTISTTQDVNQIIKLLLPTGKATIQNCAASIGVTVRTLQRMLDAEDTSFSSLLNETRLQLSVQYLSNLRMRITDIAEMLGYNSIGAFTRWHTQVFGLSPRAMRKVSLADKGIRKARIAE